MTEARDAYLQKLKARLDEMSADLQKLESRLQRLHADARIRYAENVDRLEKRRDLLEKKMEDVKLAGKESWTSLKEETDEALTALVAGMADAKERLESILQGD